MGEEEEEEEVGVVKADRRSLDSDEGVLDAWPRREGDRSPRPWGRADVDRRHGA